MMIDAKYLTSDAAEEHVRAAFRHIVDARRDMTIYGFSQFVQENIAALGGRGFLVSIGNAITAAVERENGTQPKRASATSSAISPSAEEISIRKQGL